MDVENDIHPEKKEILDSNIHLMTCGSIVVDGKMGEKWEKRIVKKMDTS